MRKEQDAEASSPMCDEPPKPYGMAPHRWCTVAARELRFCAMVFGVALAVMVLGIWTAEAVDAEASSCGSLTPMFQYRLMNHVIPILNVCVAVPAALFVCAAVLASYLRPRARLIINDVSFGLALLLVRVALFLLMAYLAVVSSTLFVRTYYPQCHIHRPPVTTNFEQTAASIMWAETETSPIAVNLSAAVAGPDLLPTHLPTVLLPPYELDMMMVAVKPTCINRAAVERAIHNFGPRRLFIVTPGKHCKLFESYETRVHCIPEDTIVPGMSVPVLNEYFKQRGADLPSFKGKNLGGWYLQQFAKLLFWTRVPDLSEHFLIWDSDMIMTEQYRYFNRHGQIRQHTGGAFVHGYATSFFQLTGQPMLYGPRWETYVVHHLPVFKPFLFRMLKQMGLTPDVDPLAWVYRVLDTVPRNAIQLGFSEYNSYVSWVLHHHKERLGLVTERRWLRYAPSYAQPARSAPNCCPSPHMIELAEQRLKNTEFFGYEFGHFEYCHYSDPQYKDHYP